MKITSVFIPFAILVVLTLLLSMLPYQQVSADEYSPCPSGTGPGGITAGDYDPTTLTQEQRQWLFEIFGNVGIAPVGYGGQRCGQTPPTTAPHPAWFGQGCGTSYTGPGGIQAGDYAPTSLTQDQRQWLFEVFGNEGIASVGYGGQHCSWQDPTPIPPPPPSPSHPAWFGQGCGTSYTGPGGIRAGSYDPTTLTQDQRQWIFEVFGNEGYASVGYGGSTSCSGQNTSPSSPSSSSSPSSPSHPAWYAQGCGTAYMGPGAIRPGGYSPSSLTQAQRQWLFEVFGNNGQAPAGYGGQTCPWQSQTTGGGSNPGDNNSSGTSGGSSGNSSSETWTQTTPECNINAFTYEFYRTTSILDLVMPRSTPILNAIKTFFDYVGVALKLIPAKHNIIADEVKITFFVSNKGNYKVQIDRYLQGQLLTTDTYNVDKDTYNKLLENSQCSLLG